MENAHTDIDEAYVDSLYAPVRASLVFFDLIVFVPKRHDYTIELENDGHRPVEDLYRDWVDADFKRIYREQFYRVQPPKHIVADLGAIESSMCQHWVGTVRKLWGRRDPKAEQEFCPTVKMQTESWHSELAGEVTQIRLTHSKPNNKALIYAYGGGWLSPLNTDHIKWAKYFAELTGITMFAVEYKLAPEHPFPVCVSRWCRSALRR